MEQPDGKDSSASQCGLHNVNVLVVLLTSIQVFKLFSVIYLLTRRTDAPLRLVVQAILSLQRSTWVGHLQ